ncbi:MAG: hypothetical protein AAB342_06805 [Chloroflexota bacterium]
METITYTAIQKAKTFNALIGGFFAIIGSLFLCCGLGVGVLALASFSNTAQGQSAESFAVMPLLACGFVALGGLFVAVGIWAAIFAARGQQLQLTPDALIEKDDRRSTTLRLADIIRLSVDQGRQATRSGAPGVLYWYVLVETAGGEQIKLEITQDNYFGTFDAQKVMRDLLPRLPATTTVDPRIRNYIAVGRMA